MRKGQFFILAAVFILMGIVAIKNIIGFYDISAERQFQESSLINKNLENIKNEYIYLTGIASYQEDVNASSISYLWNFSSLIRNTRNAKIIYAYIFYNASNSNYSVTIGNFYGDKIYVVLNTTESTPEIHVMGSMNDRTNLTKEFDSSSNEIINVTLIYNTQTAGQIIDKISFDSTKYSSTGFFDITLYTDNLLVRTKELYNRTW